MQIIAKGRSAVAVLTASEVARWRSTGREAERFRVSVKRAARARCYHPALVQCMAEDQAGALLALFPSNLEIREAEPRRRAEPVLHFEEKSVRVVARVIS